MIFIHSQLIVDKIHNNEVNCVYSFFLIVHWMVYKSVNKTYALLMKTYMK